MAQFSYVDLGAGLPSTPIVTVKIYPPEWEREGENDELVYSCTAFIDPYITQQHHSPQQYLTL
jgi:hypothetical protein